MGISFQEALTIPPLNKAKIIAGANGLNRSITMFGVLDAGNLTDWIKDNGLILITGYLPDPSLNLCEVIKMADAKGAAGIVFQFEPDTCAINEEVIKLANELGFPILSLPFEHSWTDYFNRVGSAIREKDTAEIKRLTKVLGDFTGVILAGEGLDSLVQIAGATLHCPCAFFDAQGNLLSYFGYHPDYWHEVNDHYRCCLPRTQIYEGIYCCNTKESTSEFFQIISEIQAGNEHFGNFFFLTSHTLSNYDLIILRQVLSVSCLVFQKNKAVAAVERINQESFINDLVLGLILDKNIIRTKLDSYGLKLEQGGTVVIVDLHDKQKKVEHKNQHASNTRYLFDTYFSFPNTISTCLADQLVMIIPTGNNVAKTVNKITDTFKNNLPGKEFKIAIGRSIPDNSKIHQSYKDARNILKLADFCNETVLDYKNLGLVRLLLDKVDRENLKEFCSECFGSIQDYQIEHNTNLLDTLEVYYQENCNIRNTAKRLFIHFNTVRYRLNLIKDIAKLDIDHPDVKATLTIALKIRTAIEKITCL